MDLIRGVNISLIDKTIREFQKSNTKKYKKFNGLNSLVINPFHTDDSVLLMINFHSTYDPQLVNDLVSSLENSDISIVNTKKVWFNSENYATYTADKNQIQSPVLLLSVEGTLEK